MVGRPEDPAAVTRKKTQKLKVPRSAPSRGRTCGTFVSSTGGVARRHRAARLARIEIDAVFFLAPLALVSTGGFTFMPGLAWRVTWIRIETEADFPARRLPGDLQAGIALICFFALAGTLTQTLNPVAFVVLGFFTATVMVPFCRT